MSGRRKKRKENRKIKEKRLEKRILEMRKARNTNRRGNPKESEQPPVKRRKTGEDDWKEVRQMGAEAKKRKEGGSIEMKENQRK